MSEPNTNRKSASRCENPAFNQAAKIIARFGGDLKMAAALGCHRVTIYRWTHGRPYGSDGLIPGPSVERVLEAAQRCGIVLSAEDWLPERIAY